MATQTLNTRIALKSDTTANWAKSTLVLLKGEQAIELQNLVLTKLKLVMELKHLLNCHMQL